MYKTCIKRGEMIVTYLGRTDKESLFEMFLNYNSDVGR
jgi:hypothetical protein